MRNLQALTTLNNASHGLRSSIWTAVARVRSVGSEIFNPRYISVRVRSSSLRARATACGCMAIVTVGLVVFASGPDAGDYTTHHHSQASTFMSSDSESETAAMLQHMIGSSDQHQYFENQQSPGVNASTFSSPVDAPSVLDEEGIDPADATLHTVTAGMTSDDGSGIGDSYSDADQIVAAMNSLAEAMSGTSDGSLEEASGDTTPDSIDSPSVIFFASPAEPSGLEDHGDVTVDEEPDPIE